MDYSTRAKKYAGNFSSHVLGKRTEDLILGAVSNKQIEEI